MPPAVEGRFGIFPSYGGLVGLICFAYSVSREGERGTIRTLLSFALCASVIVG
jgi:ABC-type transport system involved in multi-copper enzyme maturation permease subunit